MEIRTKEELMYIIDFYGLGDITIFSQGNPLSRRIGRLSNELKYSYSPYQEHLKPEYEYLAIDYAIRFVNQYIDKITKWREVVARKFETAVVHGEKDQEFNSGRYSWTADFKDSGVEVLKNENGSNVIIRGTIDQLRKFKEYANNHLRYCGGYYSYENDEVLEWLAIFREFGLFEKYDSFEEYYHGGIVD